MNQPSQRAAGPGVTVAVDGSSGSGKSSVSREVASRLGVGYLDTGAMYRALAWWCMREGIIEDRASIAQRCGECDIEVSLDPAQQAVRCDGTDVTAAIRTPQVSQVVSFVATTPEVRERLVALQRQLMVQARVERGGVIAEGRDITTVVAPDAEVRVLLVADPQVRVNRRAKDFSDGDGKNESAALEAAHQELARDASDSTVNDFWRPAPGVTAVDTTNRSFNEVVDLVCGMVPQATSEESRSGHVG